MAKRLTDISNFIESNALPFKEHFVRTIDSEVVDLLDRLSEKSNVYIFSGVIRNYFLKIAELRDVDIVYSGDIKIEDYLNGLEWRKNSFGGYKISVRGISIDIWQLEDTWALRYQGTFNFDLAKFIPNTAFFNFSSIIFWYNKNKFFFSVHFTRFLRDKNIELTFAPNANVSLCIVNSLYYMDKLNLRLGDRLIRYLKSKSKRPTNDYESVQIKHFGRVLYSPNKILERIRAL